MGLQGTLADMAGCWPGHVTFSPLIPSLIGRAGIARIHWDREGCRGCAGNVRPVDAAGCPSGELPAQEPASRDAPGGKAEWG